MTSQTEPTASSRLPLFYAQPQLLSSAVHAAWRLTDGDAAFAAKTAFTPIVVGELAAAARDYPVVFAAGDIAPVALLGLEHDNLFVEDGQWVADAYVPAYVRRYPFGFIATVNPDGFALAVDAASDRVVEGGDEGAPLFVDGEPSDITRQALAFCDAFQGEVTATQAFCAALQDQNLLIDRRADATLPDGRTLGLDGFQIVDAEAFAALDDAVVVDWHRKGWLALVHHHLASLQRFSALLVRQGARAAVTTATPISASTPAAATATARSKKA